MSIWCQGKPFLRGNPDSPGGAGLLIRTHEDITLQHNHKKVIVDTDKATGDVRVTLPANPSVGQEHHIKDGDGECPIHHIIVDGNLKTIDGEPEFVLNFPYVMLRLTYNGTEWSNV